jgi:hypothetical protein
MITQLNTDINTIHKDIEELKRWSESFESPDANAKID